MSIVKSTSYAPDVFKHLTGILLACKPPNIQQRVYVKLLTDRLSDQLNQLEPRPLSKKLVIIGAVDEEKRITQVPNLADHPLVVGPRYMPNELRMGSPFLMGNRMSGVMPVVLGREWFHFNRKGKSSRLTSIYHIKGKFGYLTDNFFSDGKILDKATFKYIKPRQIDMVCAKIQSSQHERLFDSSNVPIHSQEAYELAKAWPSMPPKMSKWPIIFRIRCIHFRPPEFKLEVTCANVSENFLGQLTHDVGQQCKSAAYTESIRQVRIGPFDIEDCLTDSEWNLENVSKELSKFRDRSREVYDALYQYRRAYSVGTQHVPEFARDRTEADRSPESQPRHRTH